MEIQLIDQNVEKRTKKFNVSGDDITIWSLTA